MKIGTQLKCKNNLIMDDKTPVFTKGKTYQIIEKSFGGFVLFDDEEEYHTIPIADKWYKEFIKIK